MSQNHLFIQQLGFEYPGTSDPLFTDLQFTCTTGWTGICGANGSGKSTLLQLIAGRLLPDTGSVSVPGSILYCEQRTDEPPGNAAGFLNDYSPEACILLGKLGIEEEWLERWSTLSHGERKRVQIGTALWENPDVLLVDEPTNHLDLESTELLIQSLEDYEGIGVIVTHDRNLLDHLCFQCLWLEESKATMRSGGYSSGQLAIDQEAESVAGEAKKLKAETDRLSRTAAHYRTEASRAHQRRSKRGLALKDHDARAKMSLVRVSGKDGQDGRRLHQMEGRLQQLNQKREFLQPKKEYEMGIWMDFRTSARNNVLVQDATEIPLGDGKVLHLPRLELRPQDKIVLKGLNGSGKSTLIQHVVEENLLLENELLYLPQEITAVQSREILDNARNLPKAELGNLMRIVRRLGSDPKRLLVSDMPSPGELRKLLLALGILRQPGFLVIDEPTNHLDLPSIVCLEKALRECPCGYLLVSHDRRFLEALGETCWEMVVSGSDVQLKTT